MNAVAAPCQDMTAVYCLEKSLSEHLNWGKNVPDFRCTSGRNMVRSGMLNRLAIVIRPGFNIISNPNAPVAQWIEQWIPNPFVGCSIHPGGTSQKCEDQMI